LNAAQWWLSYDIVRLKIEVGVEEKSKCKTVTRNEHDGHFDDATRQPSLGYSSSARAQSVDAVRPHTV